MRYKTIMRKNAKYLASVLLMIKMGNKNVIIKCEMASPMRAAKEKL